MSVKKGSVPARATKRTSFSESELNLLGPQDTPSRVVLVGAVARLECDHRQASQIAVSSS